MISVQVQTSHDFCEPFKKRRIVEVLVDEAQVKEPEAWKIARSIERKIKRLNPETITTAEIREEVNSQLRNRGMLNEARKHERVGIPTAEIKNLIREHDNSNANVGRNPEAVHKYIADRGMKQYTLMELPSHIAKAHDKGNFHIHDLEYFPSRPLNCLQHDLRCFIRHGLKVDGSGEHTSSAGSAKNIETLVNHAGQVLMASQVFMSGGQSMPFLNVFMAPYIHGLPYERIKQAMQMLIFNLNMSYVSRGGQAVFSSVNMEFDVPKILEEETAWGPSGKAVGTYGDYIDETKLLRHAFTEVLLEGDSMGKPHLFPNSVYVLRKESLQEENYEALRQVHELSAKFSTPYFANVLPKWTGGHSNLMGCRTRLNTNWTGDWDKDTLRTGNLAYVTINLPRLAYKGDVLDGLADILPIAEEVLLIRRQQALKCMREYGLQDFLSQKMGNEKYYRIENATLSFGFVGINEMLKAMGIEDGILSTEGQRTAEGVLQYMNDYAKDLQEETDYRWTILQTPAETTAHRFAELDRRAYPKAVVNGEPGSSYYTNSTHVPVDSGLNIIERIKIEEKFHPLTAGGHIFHAWIGEATPDVDALTSLTSKTIQNTNTGFFAYSSAFSYCFYCNTHMRGLQDKCYNCKNTETVEWYDRITGYVQAVGHKKNASGGWNPGKQNELTDRKRNGI